MEAILPHPHVMSWDDTTKVDIAQLLMQTPNGAVKLALFDWASTDTSVRLGGTTTTSVGPSLYVANSRLTVSSPAASVITKAHTRRRAGEVGIAFETAASTKTYAMATPSGAKPLDLAEALHGLVQGGTPCLPDTCTRLGVDEVVDLSPSLAALRQVERKFEKTAKQTCLVAASMQ